MTFLRHIRSAVWPFVKVRARFYWWAIKYRGRKNIPPELIFGQMMKSLESLNHNLMQALRHIPNEGMDKEKSELINLLRIGSKLDEEVSAIKNNTRGSSESSDTSQ